jgi:hypothetical protein
MMLRGALKAETVLALFDRIAGEIADSARRDARKWQAMHRAYYPFRRDFTTPDDELALVRKWIVDRWAFINGLKY